MLEINSLNVPWPKTKSPTSNSQNNGGVSSNRSTAAASSNRKQYLSSFRGNKLSLKSELEVQQQPNSSRHNRTHS